MILEIQKWQQDVQAKNLHRADVVHKFSGIKVGFMTQQTYKCKGGLGATFKMYALLSNGTDTTYVWSSSINGGDLTHENEQCARRCGLEILTRYVEKHGVPGVKQIA
jgi:hypothetical protein